MTRVKAARGVKFLNWFLLANLLLIRFLRPIFSALEVFSFRLWIDWMLLFAFLSNRRALKSLGPLSWLTFFASAVIVISNLAMHGVGEYGLLEAIGFLLVLSVPLYYAALSASLDYGDALAHKIAVVRILNVYFFANTLIILGQVSGVVPVPDAFLSINASNFDHFTGLIGLNGVSTLNFLWIATIAGNITLARTEGRGRLVVALTQIVTASSLSLLIDNKMFALTFLASSILVLALNPTIIRRFAPLIAIAVVVLAPWFLGTIESTFSTESGRSLDLPSIILFDSNFAPNENNERAYINYLAFAHYSASEFGIGLGFASAESVEIHPHLGINSASLVLIQGGIPLLLAAVATLFVGFKSILGRPRPTTLIALLFFAVAIVYASNPIADRYTLIAACLFIYLSKPMTGHEDDLQAGANPRLNALELSPRHQGTSLASVRPQ